jgi:hypothetical protein
MYENAPGGRRAMKVFKQDREQTIKQLFERDHRQAQRQRGH